jgi:hypothetical protein
MLWQRGPDHSIKSVEDFTHHQGFGEKNRGMPPAEVGDGAEEGGELGIKSVPRSER